MPPVRSRNGPPHGAVVRHAVQVEDRRARVVLGARRTSVPPISARRSFTHVPFHDAREGHSAAVHRHPDAASAPSSSACARRTDARCRARTAPPVDELVLTVLSQNTNDRNRDVAYARLRERFASWDAVRDAPVAEVEEAIRPGGLAPTKAVRIQEILRAHRRRRPGLARRGAAGGGPRLPLRAARGGPQDGGLRAAVLVRPAGRAGRHPRVPRRVAARASGERARRSTRPTTRCCGSPRRRGPVRGARRADPPRAPYLRRARRRAAASARCCRSARTAGRRSAREPRSASRSWP